MWVPRALAVMVVACAPHVDGPVDRARAIDRADGDRLAAELRELPGAVGAAVALHRPVHDPFSGAIDAPSAAVLVTIDDRADRAAVTTTATRLVHAIAPEITAPTVVVEIGAHRPVLASVEAVHRRHAVEARARGGVDRGARADRWARRVRRVDGAAGSADVTEWDKPEPTGGRELIVAQFRTVALERIERLDSGWTRLVDDPDDAEAIAMIQREVHTLKGDSRMVGFTDVDLVCHKLEDLLGLARERGYRVDEDLDLVVTMAFRFMTMLIRKRAGQSLAGIDLPGFVRQIDAILAEGRRELPIRGRVGTQPIPKLDDRALAAGSTRDRLASTALDLFLETHSERRSKRVRRAWSTLRDLVMPPEAVALAPALSKHEAGAQELARYLGKEIELAFDLGDIRAPAGDRDRARHRLAAPCPQRDRSRRRDADVREL